MQACGSEVPGQNPLPGAWNPGMGPIKVTSFLASASPPSKPQDTKRIVPTSWDHVHYTHSLLHLHHCTGSRPHPPDLGSRFRLPQERGSASNPDSPSPGETQGSLLAAEEGCSLSHPELCDEIPKGWPGRIFPGEQQEATGVPLPVSMDSKLCEGLFSLLHKEGLPWGSVKGTHRLLPKRATRKRADTLGPTGQRSPFEASAGNKPWAPQGVSPPQTKGCQKSRFRAGVVAQ